MKQNNDNDSKLTWRVWLIKNLLINHTNKDDVLKILSDNSNLNTKNNYDDLDDNNKNELIRNILKLSEKSVEDVTKAAGGIESFEATACASIGTTARVAKAVV